MVVDNYEDEFEEYEYDDEEDEDDDMMDLDIELGFPDEEIPIIELNDFQALPQYPLDESEERYNVRVFKNGMEERDRILRKKDIIFFDPSQIEGVPDARDKAV